MEHSIVYHILFKRLRLPIPPPNYFDCLSNLSESSSLVLTTYRSQHGTRTRTRQPFLDLGPSLITQLTNNPTSPVGWTGCHVGVGVSRYFGTPWYELESNQWHKVFQTFALPTELPYQMWGWEILFVLLVVIHLKLLKSIPFSREQHNVVDNDGVPVSLQS